jgi:CRISPR system Cascade subunit CasC
VSIFVDVHSIQTLPYANVNRDAEGSPKHMIYGGVNRTRVSSQSWKRAIRHNLEDALGERAARTRLLPTKIQKRLEDAGWPTELAQFAAAQVVGGAEKALKIDPKSGSTSVLLYLPASAVTDLADLCQEHRAELEAEAGKKKPEPVLPKDRVTALIQGRTATINLFGRMLAEIPGSNVDGAVQVAHAFTTHESDSQRDFFTAVDDWLDASADSGAGHLSTGEFSAGVFYRYATINLDDLLANLDHDREQAEELITMFIEHFTLSVPGAKKNSTAPHTLPDLLYIAVRDGRPVSAAAAFEKPVRHDTLEGGISEPSARRLENYLARLDDYLGTDQKIFTGHSLLLDAEKPFEHLGEHHPRTLELARHAARTALTTHAKNTETA